MNIQSVKRIIRDYTALPSVLALSIVLSACDTGQDLGKYKTELQAADDSFTVTEDKMFSGDVSLNDSVGAGRSYSLGTGASNGVVDLLDDGSFTYMPNADFFGSDSFTVNVSWGNGASATTTTSLTVEDTPDNLPEFGWEMVWSDEFDGAELDAANWTPQIGDGRFEEYPFGPLDRWGNGEEQWYLAENATVEDGNLVITARQEEVEPGFAYTSARLRTIDKVDIKYGRIEARVKAPSGKGLWSAFWMLPTDSPYTNWAAFGEVDIMEVVNASTADELVAGNSYYGFPWPNFQSAGEQAVLSSSPDGDFHVYAIEWEADEIRWYVDDVHYLTVTSDTYYTYYYAGQETGYALGPDGAPFDVDFHILLNLAVGGGLPGDVAPETVFPAQMLVDYVRVYECSADPVTGSGCASFVDESVEPKPADAPFIQSYDLYTDGAGSLTWLVGESVVSRDLEIGVFDNGGVFSLTEVAAEDEARGTVLDVVTSNAGNFSLFAKNVVKVDDVPINYFERVALINMGDSSAPFRLQAAELKFDLYIDSAGTDTASALQIKMDSEYPNLGFVQLEMADLPLDQWTTVSVKLNDLVDSFGPEGDPLDTSAVLSLFVLEPTGMAHLQVDNIQLVCGHPSTCGIKTPVSDDIPVTPPPSVDPVPGQIYIDAVDPAWAVFDCCDGTLEEEVDTGDPEYGNAMQYTYVGTTVAGFDAKAVAGENLSNFAGGTLEFDVYLVNAPDAGADTPWRLKLEAADANVNLEVGLADSVEGVEPTVGAWQHYTFSLDDLGFDLSSVDKVMVFPTWEQGNGAVVWLDNVRFVAPPGQIFMDSVDPAWALFDCCDGSLESVVDSGDPERGNVAQFQFIGTTVSGFDAKNAAGEDFTEFEGGTLEFDAYMVAAPNAGAGTPWRLKLEAADPNKNLEVGLVDSVEGVEPTVGAWQHYTFNLDDLGFRELASVDKVLVFPTWEQANGAVIWLDKVRFLKPPAP